MLDTHSFFNLSSYNTVFLTITNSSFDIIAFFNAEIVCPTHTSTSRGQRTYMYVGHHVQCVFKAIAPSGPGPPHSRGF